MAASIEPIHLQPSQKAEAAEVLCRAFMEDVAYKYVLPDPQERETTMRRLWKALVPYCMLYGEAYTTPEVAGVACWLTPNHSAYSIWRIVRTGFALPRAILSFKQPARDRMAALMQYNDEIHKRVIREPHWYLGALGVDPDHQRRGVGAALLQPVLARADLKGWPCYLETQTEDNVKFYEKQGFTVANEAVVPGHGVKLWAMIRRPRP
jgi:ribosomal protein S18 acetylase RimI-like enzyme